MKMRLAAVVCGSLLALSAPANAAVTFTFAQVGSDVVLSAVGSLNLSGAVTFEMSVFDGQLNSGDGALAVGTFGSAITYLLTTNAGPFGTGGYFNGTQDSGNRIGLDSVYAGGVLDVQAGYVSGASLSGSTTFANQTFASLGLTSGTYVYRIPNDTISVVIPAVAGVPEPATWAMMMLGFGAMGAVIRRRTKVSARIRFA